MLSKDSIELNQDGNEPKTEAEATQSAQTPDTAQEQPAAEQASSEEQADQQEAQPAASESETSESTEAPQAEAADAESSQEEVTEAPAASEATPAEAEAEAPQQVAEEVVEKPSEKGEAEAAPAASEEPAVQAEQPAEAEAASAEAEDSAENQEDEPLEVGEDFSQEELLKQIDEILDNETDLDSLITSATPNELILMLDHFFKAEEVQPYIRRVGLIKRSFDGLREQEEVPQETLSRFSTSLARFNKKRSEYQAELEKEKEANAAKKRELLTKLKEIVDSENVNLINEVRDIQNAWKEVGFVKRSEMDDLYREYRFLLDSFYKQRELHFQLRDYDRQINLEEKKKLLEELPQIIPAEEDRDKRDVWVIKNDLLTDIQMRWRAVGHIPRESMDEINEAYRTVTSEFFSLRQEFYESQDTEKRENADAKRELLDKMKTYMEFESDKPKAWNEATKALRTMQEAWQKIGPAPKEINSELWKEYRAVGNAFFGRKRDFFKTLDEVRHENLELKRKLCEQAEAHKESSNWEKSARELKDLQKEWKKIGPVPDRYSNKIWTRFRAACDAFFEVRRQHYDSLREDEVQNLKRKKELIGEVRKVSVEEAGSPEAAIGEIKEIQARWKAIGRVPYKEKDVIWKEFRAEIDQFFDDLRANRDRRNYARLKSEVKSLPEDKRTRALKGKIAKVTRRIEAATNKIEQYSTNIQFISKGKSGDALRAQIEKEIEKEKRLLKDMRKQLRQMEDLLRNPPKEEEAAPKQEAEKPAEKAPQDKQESPKEETPEDKTEAPATEEASTEEKSETAAEPEAAAPAKEAEAPVEEKAEAEEPKAENASDEEDKAKDA
jgi:hypothetical protein